MMNVKIKVYNKSKYAADSVKVAEVEYSNIQGYAVTVIEDSEIFDMGFDEVDENKEYLTITCENGDISTFRNSYIDIFKI